MGEERIGCSFELVFGEKARRRSVVFVEVRDDPVIVEPKPISRKLCRLARFSLVAREYATHRSYPRTTCHRVHARSAALFERPIGYWDARVYHHIQVRNEESSRHLE
jgi:hypothetical protein